MSAESSHRGLSFALLGLIATVVYLVAVWIALPRDIAFFDFWPRYFSVTNQRTPFAAGTLCYCFGITLFAAGGFFFPRRSVWLRSAFSVIGIICAVIGIIYVCFLLFCNVDKVQ